MTFSLISQTQTEVRFLLESNEETFKNNPFPFVQAIRYRQEQQSVRVMWRVINPASQEMFFQIGAHPAFYYPDFCPNTAERGFFSFDKKDGLSCILIAEKGCVALDKHPVSLQDGLLPLDIHTFDRDALVLEDRQISLVTLLDKQKQPHLSLEFTAPVVGLWSPPAKNAPFVCIEPWYGRCDRAHYTGEYKDKDWIQQLNGGETFEADYTITLYKEC